ncbi:Anaphase-promoting complex subunit 2 [Smittium culicis]|uniref:Anaphase-promoting complex subunit 2 n=1 Tax=Smittium culicis TaxID=133412 RepID=A0A1R1YGD4_9FUNG|nr:Anaphase-promoting complex subunit 2 [Smittium culicis]
MYGSYLHPALNSYSRNFSHQICLDLRLNKSIGVLSNSKDSMGIFKDFKDCLSLEGSRTIIGESLKNWIFSNLLNPENDTEYILSFYISLISFFKELDPTNIVLAIVAEPIHSYLRADINKCVVAEISKGKSLLFSSKPDHSRDGIHDDSDDNDNYDDFSWTPLPSDAKNIDPDFYKRSYDILNQLISIFKSKAMFFSEYQQLLAKRLIDISDPDTISNEINQVQILKSKFGEDHVAEFLVMINDISNSFSINKDIQSNVTTVNILSECYWPSIPSTNLKLPNDILKIRNEYEIEYKEICPKFSLEWIDSVGHIDLTLEFTDRVLVVNLPIICATVLMSIQEIISEKSGEFKSGMDIVWVSLKEVMSKSGIANSETVTKSISSLKDKKIVIESSRNSSSESSSDIGASIDEIPTISQVYTIAETEDMLKKDYSQAITDKLDEGVTDISFVNPMISSKSKKTLSEDTAETNDQNVADFTDEQAKDSTSLSSDMELEIDQHSAQTVIGSDYNIYWQYIVGMLSNLGPLPVDRIVQMLEMFVPDKSFSTSDKLQLVKFLEEKVSSGDLIFSANTLLYSLQ